MQRFFQFLLALVASLGMALAAINVNTADRSQLEALHGIGPVKAQAIVDYRAKNGPFRSLDDLDKVPGIGKATLAKIKDDVTFSGPSTGVSDAKKGGASASTSASTPATRTSEDTSRESRTAAPPRTEPRSSPFDTRGAKAETKGTKPDSRPDSKMAKAESKSSKAEERMASAARSGEAVDINSASAKELEELPGVGAARANAIVKGRPYRGKNDLVDRKIVPQNVYDQIKDRIVARQKK